MVTMLTFIYIHFEDGGGDPLLLTTKRDPVKGLLASLQQRHKQGQSPQT